MLLAYNEGLARHSYQVLRHFVRRSREDYTQGRLSLLPASNVRKPHIINYTLHFELIAYFQMLNVVIILNCKMEGCHTWIKPLCHMTALMGINFKRELDIVHLELVSQMDFGRMRLSYVVSTLLYTLRLANY